MDGGRPRRCWKQVGCSGSKVVPGSETMFRPHDLHNLLQRLLLIDIQSIADIMVFVPIIHHDYLSIWTIIHWTFVGQCDRKLSRSPEPLCFCVSGRNSQSDQDGRTDARTLENWVRARLTQRTLFYIKPRPQATSWSLSDSLSDMYGTCFIEHTHDCTVLLRVAFNSNCIIPRSHTSPRRPGRG